MGDAFDAYYEWLGIPPSEQPPHHYRLLGIGVFEENADVIANAADRQMGHLRGFAAGKHSKLSQKLLNEVAAARVCLLNAEKKAAYDATLRERLSEKTPPLPPAVPMAVSAVPSTVGRGDPAVLAPTMLDEGAPRRFQLDRLPAIPVAVAGVAALVLLGMLVWWLAGAGSRPPNDVEQPPIAALDPDSAGGPSVVPDGTPAPSDPNPDPDSGKGTDSSEPIAPPGNEEPEPPAEPEEPERPTAPEADPPPDEPTEPETPSEREPPEEPTVPEEPDEPEKPDEPEPSPEPKFVRRAVPDRSEQEQVRRVLDETYDTAAAQSPEARLNLAEQLASLAEKAEDPTERFVLLRRASELASEGNDPAKMLELVAQISDEFEVDRILAQAHMLDGFSKRAVSEEQIGALVEESAGVIDAALAAGRYEQADALSAAVYRTCQPAAGRAFRVDALNRRREVQEQRDRWNAFQASLETLKTKPDDEASHEIAARWYAFVQADWDRAMPHFAKGANAELRAVAQRELTRPPKDAGAQVDLADAWWSLGEAADSQMKPHWMARAAHWYAQAQAEVGSPVIQAKIAKRLEECRAVVQPVASAAAEAPPPAVAPFESRQAGLHQQAWSKHLKTPVVQTNSLQMRFVLIPPGEFIMGSAAEEVAKLAVESRWSRALGSTSQRLQAETPPRKVRITRPFYLGAYPVTQAEYKQVMGDVPYQLRIDPTRPVGSVTWYDAVDFCKQLTALPAEQAAGRGYRLPTEAEWEYACRAGSTTWFSFGDDPTVFGMHGWWRGNTQHRPQPVARLKPNPWGLFDMHGNIGQWCSDYYTAGYPDTDEEDPRGPESGSLKAVRGGCYADNPRECRSASRHFNSPNTQTYQVGFRVVLVPASELPEEEEPAEPYRRRSGGFGRPDPMREPDPPAPPTLPPR